MGSVNVLQELTSGFRERTGLSARRVKSISDLSEKNMQLLEGNLVKLDQTLDIYNVTGIILGVTGIVVTSKALVEWWQNRNQ